MRKTDKIYDKKGEEIYSIYKWENLENGMIYFGKTVRDPIIRKIEHISRVNSGKSKYYLHRAIASYTVEKFKFEVIFQSKSIEAISEAEIHFIALYNSNNKKYGYNLTAGGEGEIPNNETRLKKSLALKGRKLGPRSKEHSEKTMKGIREFYAKNKSKLLGIPRPSNELSLKQAKFNTQEAIDNLENLKKQGYTQKEIAKMFNCDERTMTRVFKRRGIYAIFK